MSYQVRFTDTTNNPIPIVVQDYQVNNEVSVAFPGKEYRAYAPIHAENFLHLLENFSSPTSPENPIQGQLWYDSTPGQNCLKVWNSTWEETSGIVKSPTIPTDITTAGRLWFDSLNTQLKVYDGEQWVLVGPQSSENSQNGMRNETIVSTSVDDLNNPISYPVLSFYVDGRRLVIFSRNYFRPRTNIPGFTYINIGINLSTENTATYDINNPNNQTRLWGTARVADALNYGTTGPTLANCFLRNDIDNGTNKSFFIKDNRGLTLGGDDQFSIKIDNYANSVVLACNESGRNLDIKLTNSGSLNSIVRVTSNNRVGINTSSPLASLDINGTLRVSNLINFTSTNTQALSLEGGLFVKKSSTFVSGLTSRSTVYVDLIDGSGNVITGSALLPYRDTANGLYDIGSTSRKFGVVYANRITGAADRLNNVSVFRMSGDVSSTAVNFNGDVNNTNLTFTTTLRSTAITDRTAIISNNDTDQYLLARLNDDNISYSLKKVSRSVFVQSLPPATMLAGVIIAYSGINLPVGYLWCDGCEVPIEDYPNLYQAIGHRYKPENQLLGYQTFALPDLRGRMPLGLDNMANTIQVWNHDQTEKIYTGGALGPANRVSDADAVGNTGGSNILATNTEIGTYVLSGQTPTEIMSSTDIMNPYLAINYIIATG